MNDEQVRLLEVAIWLLDATHQFEMLDRAVQKRIKEYPATLLTPLFSSRVSESHYRAMAIVRDAIARQGEFAAQ
jgi:hypothetical protein